MIVSNKHGIYELTHKLPNNSRLKILKKQDRSGKSNSIKLEPIAQSSSQNNNFADTRKKVQKFISHENQSFSLIFCPWLQQYLTYLFSLIHLIHSLFKTNLVNTRRGIKKFDFGFGFDPTATKFHSDTLTDCAISPCV